MRSLFLILLLFVTSCSEFSIRRAPSSKIDCFEKHSEFNVLKRHPLFESTHRIAYSTLPADLKKSEFKIERSDQQRLPFETDKAGYFYESQELDDGEYIYLTLSDGSLFIDKKFNPKIEKYNSHRSLLEGLNSDRFVIGAGELKIYRGHIQKLNNFSGSFRGDDDSLLSSVASFREKGLPFEEDTIIETYDAKRVAGKHYQDQEKAKLIYIVENNAMLKEKMISYQKFLDKLYKKFPNAVELGNIDASRFLKEKTESIDPLALLSFAQVLSITQKEGIEIIIEKIYNREGKSNRSFIKIEEFEDMIKEIEKQL
ncbi:hypothetical protein HBN50_02630 [Halobacteriovorax sp. GB3]|uniref:hypothetical protein n=1 Tax=Halobacteriovorax sp. GB3 TaxID=2719615 RepID=UPI00235DDC92|nr:hypothetical protein [Halobacteriovorax sp. GB3]MDD0851970.1 hypothetical protein [Halobacteriovorax sp. GB3]